MRILSHRGHWGAFDEMNSKSAFLRSFDGGFGTETDVRDQGGSLVISHDVPNSRAMTFSEFASLPGAANLPQALNVKADGLAKLVRAAIDAAGLCDAFAFDMSVPDMRGYFDADIPVMTRMSEVEPEPAWLERCVGVWLDGFYGTWWTAETINRLLDAGKSVCIVSPELHGREYQPTWETLSEFVDTDEVLLCTDLPLKALDALGAKK